MFSTLASFANGLASKVQESVANAAKDFEAQRQELIERKQSSGDTGEEAPPSMIAGAATAIPAVVAAAPERLRTLSKTVSQLGLRAGGAAVPASAAAAAAAAPAVSSIPPEAAAAQSAEPAVSRAALPSVTADSPKPENGVAPAAIPDSPSSPVQTSGGGDDGKSKRSVAAIFDDAADISRRLVGGFTLAVGNAAAAAATKATEIVVAVQKVPKSPAAVEMPWSALPESHGAALKEQILALSSDKRNFVVDPPEGTDFVFNMDTSLNLAMALLKADPNLEKTRFNLVPKVVKEPVFWRNYFYRVSLLSQSAALEQSRELESSGPTGTNVTVAPTSKFDDSLPRAVDLKGAAYTEEQHGSTQDSAHASGKPTEAVLHEELADGDEFATESYSGDWEKELQEELSDEQ